MTKRILVSITGANKKELLIIMENLKKNFYVKGAGNSQLSLRQKKQQDTSKSIYIDVAGEKRIG